MKTFALKLTSNLSKSFPLLPWRFSQTLSHGERRGILFLYIITWEEEVEKEEKINGQRNRKAIMIILGNCIKFYAFKNYLDCIKHSIFVKCFIIATQIVFPNNPVKYASVMTSISQERMLEYKEIKWSIQGKTGLSFHRGHRRNSELRPFPPGPVYSLISTLSAGMVGRRWWWCWIKLFEWITGLFKAEWYNSSPLFPKGVLGWVCQLIGEDQWGQVVTDAFLSQIHISTWPHPQR